MCSSPSVQVTSTFWSDLPRSGVTTSDVVHDDSMSGSAEAERGTSTGRLVARVVLALLAVVCTVGTVRVGWVWSWTGWADLGDPDVVHRRAVLFALTLGCATVVPAAGLLVARVAREWFATWFFAVVLALGLVLTFALFRFSPAASREITPLLPTHSP